MTLWYTYLKDVDTENENTHLERIYKDNSFVTSMVAKLEEFYTLFSTYMYV